MTSADNRIDELVARIKRRASMADYVFLPAYPPHKTPNPMGRYTVAVDTRSVGSKRYFIGNRIGQSRQGYIGRFELCLRVYAPERTSGSALLRATAMLMDAAEAADSEGWIRSFALSGIGFDTASRTEYRDVVLTLEILIGEEGYGWTS